ELRLADRAHRGPASAAERRCLLGGQLCGDFHYILRGDEGGVRQHAMARVAMILLLETVPLAPAAASFASAATRCEIRDSDAVACCDIRDAIADCFYNTDAFMP